jgi:hypothetical protein
MRRHMDSSEFLRLVCLSTNRRPCIYGHRLAYVRATLLARVDGSSNVLKKYLFDQPSPAP